LVFLDVAVIYSSLEASNNMFVISVIEMSSGTKHKYEQDKETGSLILDRVLPVAVPVNYGYIVNTLSEDGDPTDIFVASMEPIPPLTKVVVEVVGLIKCVDGGKEDDKLIGYIKDDKKTKSVLNVEELENKVVRYLTAYKKGMSVLSVLDSTDAAKRVKQAYSLFFSKS